MPKWFDMLALLLAVIGAVNWGLVGLLDFNVVEKILGTGTVTTVVYVIVALGGLWSLKLLTK